MARGILSFIKTFRSKYSDQNIQIKIQLKKVHHIIMSSSTDNDAEQLTLQIEGLSIENGVGVKVVICAACGKEGEEDSMNICNKCKMVYYCNVTCKKKHKSKHKKKCDRRVAELHDKALFKEPPPREEECPICMMLLPLDRGQSNYQSCCGKLICSGCIYGLVKGEIQRGKSKEEIGLCPYCRTPRAKSDEERVKRLKKLMSMEKGNADAFYVFAAYYAKGINGMPQDWAKANELYLKASELGCAEGYSRLGHSYYHGWGVEIEKKKAKHFYELAAIKGDVHVRHILGCLEGQTGNEQRAYKHMIIASKAGHKESLEYAS